MLFFSRIKQINIFTVRLLLLLLLYLFYNRTTVPDHATVFLNTIVQYIASFVLLLLTHVG